ncbi:MAG: NADH-quinone oxidoreductase subunit N [Ignavibacteriae bacterium]|nr:NADH-quinone oxidoreductase subunit N [Ignavibacteriota bacterium]
MMGYEFQFILPIILISFFATSAIVIDAVLLKNKSVGFFYSLAGLVITALAAVYSLYKANMALIPANHSDKLITKGALIFSGYAAFFDILFCIAGILTILASKQYLKREFKEINEYYSLLLLSIAGMMIIGHANNLLVLFIGIELMSIPFYILSGFFRNNLRSVEAGIKYFLLGAFATGFLLYGMALIYGATGNIEINKATYFMTSIGKAPLILSIGVGLIIIGLSFKVAAFPFHQWAPDVYQGAPTVITGFMSTAGKAAALIAMVIIIRPLIPDDIDHHQLKQIYNGDTIRLIIAFISAATMLIGNITALVQKNVKRMLAYSSVAHAGYLLMGIVANNSKGWDGIAFYSAAYMFMQIGAFVVISLLERKNEYNMDIRDYAGLSKTQPVIAAMMAIFMFSLTGIPPFAGFIGKYYLFASVIESGYVWLAIVAVIASLISIYFYIGLVISMYFKEPDEKLIETEKGLSYITLTVASAALIIFGIFPSVILNLSHRGFNLFLF